MKLKNMFLQFFNNQVATNLVTLQTCLTKMMGKPISMDQLHQDVGNMVEKITKVIAGFRQLQLKMEEYVCLKVISMVSAEGNTSFDCLIWNVGNRKYSWHLRIPWFHKLVVSELLGELHILEKNNLGTLYESLRTIVDTSKNYNVNRVKPVGKKLLFVVDKCIL